MSIHDLSSLKITNGDQSVLDAYEAYCLELLGYGANLRDLFTAADAAPDCALLNANAACLHLAFEGREGWADAQPYLAKMAKQYAYLSEHEKLFCEAVSSWSEYNFARSLTLFEEIAMRWPVDLIAIKWGQYHAFNLGDQAALLRLGRRAVETHEGEPYIHGLYAFALEQNHQIKEAETEALRAAEIAIDDAWAHHAAAHVMETEGRAADGAKWLAHCAHIWDSKGTFIREHNWWHAALFHLALGEHETVFDIFDTRLWGEWPEFPQEQIGAASMLWRLELQGVDAGDRWRPIIDQARERSGEHIFPFHDLHYLFALTRSDSDQDAEQHFQSMQKRAHECCEKTAPAWKNGGLPAAEGILAFSRGDMEQSAQKLEQAMPYLGYIGGSHAQRAIFHDTYAIAKQRAIKATSGDPIVALGE